MPPKIGSGENLARLAFVAGLVSKNHGKTPRVHSLVVLFATLLSLVLIGNEVHFHQSPKNDNSYILSCFACLHDKVFVIVFVGKVWFWFCFFGVWISEVDQS